MARKRRRRRERGGGDGVPSIQPLPAAHPPPNRHEPPSPSPITRIAGAAFALLTAGLAALLVIDALGGGLAAVDVGARLIAAGALAAVALALAALSLAPRAVRAMLKMRSSD